MSELQSTIEFSVELYKFYNVDLFQRGMYQVRCSLRVSSKLSVEVEVTTPEVSAGLGTALVLGNYGACRPFQILYRNEEVSLKDVVLFRCHMLVDGHNLKESLERAEFSLILELWFSDTSPVSMVMVSARTLQLNFSPIEGLHYHLPVLFDYFHLSAISLTIHAVLTALHQPSMKRGILRYMQSCAPKSSKSWSKIRSAHCSSLTDPVLPVSSHKIYSKINESPQVHLEARDVLLDASNNLKSTIKEYKLLFMQREEILSENYDTLITKPHRSYDSRKKKQVTIAPSNSCLAELCADNIRLWNYFLLNFSCKTTIQQYLSKKHHNLRVRRFAELFFLVYNPRRSAIGCFDTSYQNYLLVAEIARRSKYVQNLPPLPVHCSILDGDYLTMPIIFEDQYQDPFEFDKLGPEDVSILPKQDSFKRSKTVNDTKCSCGIENVWDVRKSSEKTLVNYDLFNYEDPILTIPARHSKSLDQLQLRSRNNFNSLGNILGAHNHTYRGYHHQDKSNFYHNNTDKKSSVDSKLKNVASEHNMRTHQRMYIFDDDLRLLNSFGMRNEDEPATCNCREKKHFKVKHVAPTSAHHHQKSIVKSASNHAENAQNIFRSNSMQFISPKKANGVSKFNSLASRRSNGGKNKFDAYVVEVNGAGGINSSTNKEYYNVNNQKRSKSKSKRSASSIGGRHFEIGSSSTSSTSSSTESLSSVVVNCGSILKKQTKKKTGSNSEALVSIVRKVRSTSCLGEQAEQVFPTALLSGTESLPNITPVKAERMGSYPEMRYYSSCSTSSTSTTSEQSGWITSRSSSVASSTDVTNPATSAMLTNAESIQRKILMSLTSTSLDSAAAKRKSNGKHDAVKSKFYGTRDTSNGFANGHRDSYSNKGCEFLMNQIDDDDDIALPPPKQFRDLDSPSSSITNGTTVAISDIEEINAIDNLLYHVVDTQTNLERTPSSRQSKSKKDVDHHQPPADDFHFYRRGSRFESEKSFKRARNEFKGQLNFPGILYSDLGNFASTVPYFHISDEFRIFSPEGMHLIVCVHGLDGNSADLRLVKTYLELGLPGAYLDFLMSERNQGDTFSDFDTMTDRLVSEILHYLDASSIRPTRISFVGHSLGTVIIRSALTRPQMKFLLPRLHTFLSLSGPHLGTLYNSSGLVNMGMWFMQKWKKSGSLLQLCLKDHNDARQSFLYKLSQKSTLHHFKNVLLCGSGQDRYVPLHSARIELCKESIKDTSDQGAIYREMVHNIISPIVAQKEVNLVRYDIHHALPNTANALIGRAAHIAVLDSELFIEKFMAVVGIKYFR